MGHITSAYRIRPRTGALAGSNWYLAKALLTISRFTRNRKPSRELKHLLIDTIGSAIEGARGPFSLKRQNPTSQPLHHSHCIHTDSPYQNILSSAGGLFHSRRSYTKDSFKDLIS